MEKLAYVLGPVRQIDSVQRSLIKLYVDGLEHQGYLVFDPMRNAPQEDPTGFNIVMAEHAWLRSMADGKERGDEPLVLTFWTNEPPYSEGSRVDAGMVLGFDLEPELAYEWGNGWDGFYGNAINRREFVNTYVKPSEHTGDILWHTDMDGVCHEGERVNLGLYLALLSRLSGFKLGNLNLIGEDDPNKKSYPKVVQEIQRRQLEGIPLW